MTDGFNRGPITWGLKSDPSNHGVGLENTRVNEHVHPLGGHQIEIPVLTADRLSEFDPPPPC